MRCAVVFLFTTLAVRLVYVQAILRTELQHRANRQFSGGSSSTESRFQLLDINRQVISETVQVYSCYVDPTLIKNKSHVSMKLAAELRLPEKEVAERIKSASGSFAWIKHNVSSEIMHRIKEENIPGVGFKIELRRHYPLGPLASHLLGLVGVDGHGLSGIEQSFEKSLSASSLSLSKSGESLPSGHVQLTLDASIQRAAERELNWGIEKTGAKKGYVVIQNPWTGDIVAAASWPPVSLDPDNPPDPKDLRIPVLVDVFEPGSTYKIVTAAAALEENVIKSGEIFDGENGKWKVYGITIHDHEPIAKMTFEDILIHSSNIGTSKIADRLGSQRLFQYSRLFGFGVFPGSGIFGEARGVLRLPNKWSGVSKYAVSFGQEVGVTPIQLAGAYSAIANGGNLMEPRFIKSIISDDGEVLWENKSMKVRRVVSEKTAAALTDILTKVVEKGTGINAQIQWDPSTKVAGKTGTAQKYDSKNGRYDNRLSVVSFCGFFPAQNPQFTMIVVLDEPEGRSWGGLDAAPVFRRIAEHLNPRLATLSKSATMSEKPKSRLKWRV